MPLCPWRSKDSVPVFVLLDISFEIPHKSEQEWCVLHACGVTTQHAQPRLSSHYKLDAAFTGFKAVHGYMLTQITCLDSVQLQDRHKVPGSGTTHNANM